MVGGLYFGDGGCFVDLGCGLTAVLVACCEVWCCWFAYLVGYAAGLFLVVLVLRCVLCCCFGWLWLIVYVKLFWGCDCCDAL